MKYLACVTEASGMEVGPRVYYVYAFSELDAVKRVAIRESGVEPDEPQPEPECENLDGVWFVDSDWISIQLFAENKIEEVR